MKTIVEKIYQGLISWAEMIREYRQSQSSKHYY